MKINLAANSDFEKMVLAYLEDNASESLAEKINNGKKTLAGCFQYVKTEARKQAVNGCAAIMDQEVFGWCIHYFEEDALNCEKEKSTQPKPTKEETDAYVSRMREEVRADIARSSKKATVQFSEPPKKKEDGMSGQMTFEDLFASGGAWEDIGNED